MDEEIDWDLFDEPVRELQNQSVCAAVSSALAAIQSEASVRTSLVDNEENR